MSEEKDDPDTVETPVFSQLKMPLDFEEQPLPQNKMSETIIPISERNIDPNDPNAEIKRRIQAREKKGQTPEPHWSDRD